MAWQVEFQKSARTSLKKLDKVIRGRIENFIDNIAELPNPRIKGKALTGAYAGLWRYRVGNNRIVCSIHDNILVIEVVKIDHRREVYKK